MCISREQVLNFREMHVILYTFGGKPLLSERFGLRPHFRRPCALWLRMMKYDVRHLYDVRQGGRC